jgi:hypothetical protein
METLLAAQIENADSVLARAMARTDRVFAEAERLPATCGNLNLVWSLYDRVHLEVSLPIELGLSRAEGAGGTPRRLPVRSWLGAAFRHVLPFIYSLVSLAYLRLRGGARIAIWTGDFNDPRTGGDFRMGHLYSHLQKLNVPFLEFIRENHRGGLRQAIKNCWERRRWAVYYDACSFFLAPASRVPPINVSDLSDPEARDIFARYEGDLARTISSVGLFRKWFSWLGIRGLVAWEYSSRQASLIASAKLQGLPVIGFMHGAGMRSYMIHEFIPGRAGMIGPDVFGVWSAWWKEYYVSRAGIYGKVEIAGPMRLPEVGLRARRAGSGVPTALWISEPLLNPAEAVPWLRHLRKGYRVIIKKRPSTSDAFYNGLVKDYPEFGDLEIREGDIFKAISEADVVLGSHSTGVADASLIGVPFLFVATRKWGDYFELSDADSPYRLFVRNTEELDLSLEWVRTMDVQHVLTMIRERFYGTGESDGSRWVADRARIALEGGRV